MSVITGTNAGNILIGTNQSDVITGLKGSDIILAGNGNDQINAGDGNDIVDGGNGNDTIDGGAGNDILDGGNGDDTVLGGAGTDIVYGDNGNDTLDGGAGSDLVLGGQGNDTLIYTASENAGSYDIYDGGAGRDTLRLVVSQALANSAAFKAEIAQIQAQLARGSVSHIFQTLNLTATSFEVLQVVIAPATGNHAPVAQNDTVAAVEDTAITISAATLLANDTDFDVNDTKTLVSVQSAVNGTVSIVNGNVVFAPPANFSGIGTFTYTMKDAAGATSTAAVTVNIAPVADAPTLTVANATGNEDTAIALNVSAALKDADGSEHLASLIVSAIPVGATLSDGTHTFTAIAGQTSVNVLGWTLGSLTVKPPANSDIDFALSVTATSQEGASGPTASTTASLNVVVNPIADAPTLTAANALGNEDAAIALNVSAVLKDADGSEHLASLIVSAIPVGATLSDGTHAFTAMAGQTSVNVLSWTLGTLTVKPPANSDVDFALSVTATSQEGASGPTASTTASLNVVVNPIADAPTLTVANALGNEDAAIALNVSAALNDTDGSEHLILVVSDIPTGATLSDGTHSFTADSAQTSTGIAGWSLANLKILPPANSDVDFALTLTAISQEGAGGPTASATTTLNVVVNPVADAPTITTAPASGTTDAAIALNIGVALTDASETLGSVVQIDNVPGSFTLNHGSPTDDGGWLVQRSDLADLQLVPVAGAAKPGNFTLDVTATSADGSDIAATTGHLTVTVAAGATQQLGRVVDGYVVGATVFADTNGNGHLDDGEASTTTAADGTFVLTGGSGALVMFGGTDVSTGVAFTGTMTAPEGSSVVTPLTTLVAAIAGANADATALAAAQAQVAAAFGFDPTIDLQTYDPVPAAISGDATATAVLSAAIQVQSTISQMSAVAGASADVVGAIATAVVNAPPNPMGGANLDLSNTITVNAIATGAGVSAEALDTVTSVVSAAVGSIQGAGNVSELAHAATVAQGSATAALAGITDFTDSAQTDAVTDTYVADIGNQVINAEVGDIDGPLLGTLGNDVLTGTSGVDAIDGLDGDDAIDGAAGNDLLYGHGGRDQITGGAGNDTIDGGEGFDRSVYSTSTGGIAVQLAAGTVAGNASVGVDTLRGVEGIVGSNSDDSFDASNFTASSTNGGGLGITIAGGTGAQGSFNEFEGLGGNDVVTGNGATRISYQHASAAVTVVFANGAIHGTAHGTAAGDAANVGTDDLVGGISQVRGSSFDDAFTGSANANGTAETFEGWGGNDFIDGGAGFDRARYDNQNTGTLGITVNLGGGTVTGRDAAATAVVGSDTLRSVESIRGTNAADVFDATTFTANSTNGGGDQGTFNEFEGMGGNDQILGNGNTRIGYVNATAGVTVTMTAVGVGTADGDGSVGHDTFSGVNTVRGSSFNDTLSGSSNSNNTTENFEGWAGDDTLIGGGGFDRARYDTGSFSNTGIPLTLGISVTMASGLVEGRDDYAKFIYGKDTLVGIESVRGSNADDIYDATGLTTASANAGDTGANGLFTFNEFEGMGGSDTITGNGNTRVTFVGATEGVTVDLAAGTVVGGASVGTDTIVGGGVNQVRGSAFADSITGAAGADTLDGQGGADTINGGAGNDRLIGGGGNDTIDGGSNFDIAVFTGARSQYTITGAGVAGSSTVADTIAGRDGTDTLTTVELTEFTNTYVLNQRNLNASTFGGLTAGKQILGTNNNVSGVGDDLTIGANGNGRLIDLAGGGDDTLTLGTAGTYNLNLANVEVVAGSTSDDTVTLTNGVNGMSIDLGGGTDSLTFFGLATVSNVENIRGSSAFDNVTLGSAGAVAVNGVETLTGSGGDDQVTLNADAGITSVTATIDLGGGTDSLNLNVFGTPQLNLMLTNVESVTSTGGIESLTLQSVANGMAVDLGAGFDTLNLAAGDNVVTVTNVETLNAFGGGNNTVTFFADSAVTNQVINLGFGANVLNLAGADDTLSMLIQGPSTIVHDQTVSGNLSLNLLNQQTGNTFDFGTGTNDTLQLFTPTVGTNDVTVANIEHVLGSSAFDSIHIAGNADAATEVTGGVGSDWIYASADVDHFVFTAVQDSYNTPETRDIVQDFNADQDAFVFTGAVAASIVQHDGDVVGSGIDYLGTAAFTNTGHAQANIFDFGGGVQVLSLDIDGDGTIGANDMTIELRNYTGTLDHSDFVII